MKFRRILPLVLLLAILFLLPFGAEAAENSCGKKATWRMSSAGVLYIEGTGDMYDYDMNNLPPWYSRRDEITTIDIGINITHIGDYAFYGCSNVTIIRNMKVKSIGTYAMSCCSKLKNVILPEGVTVLDRYTFQGCTGLKTVVLPSTLEVIDQRAFMDCSGMIGIEIPASVTKINYEAFFGCSALKGITFKGNAPTISTSAFRVVNATARYPQGNTTWNADTKKNYGGVLTWEESPAYDGRCGFDVYWRMDGTNLILFGSGPMDSYFITNDVRNTWKTATTVTVGEGITDVCGFSGLSGLTSASLPSTLTTIKDWAFDGTTGLKSITLPSGLKELGAYAFQSSGIRQITIPDSITTFGIAPFSGSKLETVTLPDTWTSIPGYLFSGTYSLVEVEIPSGVTKIEENAFAGSAIKRISLPQGLQEICDEAFWLADITSVVIPDSVTTMGTRAFAECDALESAVLSGGMTTVPDGVFSGCKALKSVVIPKEVTAIGEDAFYGCTSLESVTLPDGLETIGDYGFAFSGLEQIDLPDSLKTLGDSALQDTNLTTITLPKGIEAIGEAAFAGTAITEFAWPAHLTTIPIGVFADCFELKNVAVPEGVTTVGGAAFWECTSLTTIKLPDSVTDIGDSAFAISGLTEFTFPKKVTQINEDAFYACGDLKSVVIPNTITSIRDAAFEGSGLTEITIPASVTGIDDYAFASCADLKTVRFLGEAPTIANTCFDDISLNAWYPPSGTWTESVRSNYGGTVTWNPYVPNVVIHEVKPHETGNILYWNAVTGGDIYQIYRLNGSSWELLKNTRSLAYKDETAKVGVKHYYKIVARNGDLKSDIATTASVSAVRPASGLPNVTVNKTVGHVTGNILYWDAVAGGDIYQVYRLNGSSWELLKNTRSLAYKDETAKVGVKHYYKIVARNGDLKSDIATTASASVTRPAPASLENVTIYKTLGHSSGNILYWNAVSGAQLYQVYRLDNGSWKLLKNTGSLAYKDETAPVGIKCYYKIVARSGDVKSNIATTASASATRPS